MGRFARNLACCASALLASLPGDAVALSPGRVPSQYVHDTWQLAQGLPQSRVAVILQTRDGYLWVGTQVGVSRFDGVSFTSFDRSNTPALTNNWITALEESADGSLWIGTLGGGLVRRHGGVFERFGADQGLGGEVVSAIVKRRRGGVWVGVPGAGVAEYVDGHFKLHGKSEGLQDDEVTSLWEDDTTLWVGTRRGLARFDGRAFAQVASSSGDPKVEVNALLRDQGGRLWLGTEQGLGVIDGSSFSLLPSEPSGPQAPVRALAEDRDRNLWVGTSRGLFRSRLGGEGWSAALREEDSVLALVEDREGSLWIGTESAGLNRLRDGKFAYFPATPGLSGRSANAVCADPSGSTWVGTECCGLFRIRDQTVRSWGPRQGVGSDVRSLWPEPSGALWVGTDQGLVRVEGDAVVPAPEGMRGEVVRALLQDREGATWTGSSDGVLRLQGGAVKRYGRGEGLTNLNVYALLEDSRGTLWAGTFGGGLHRLGDDRFSALTVKDGLGSDFVIALAEDQEHDVWVGTYGGGLNRLRGSTITHFGTREGLPDDDVGAILDDGRGNLWLSSSKGVFVLNRAELARFERRELAQLPVQSYGLADGMVSPECNGGRSPAVWATRDPQGRATRIFFPTVAGVAFIDPDDLHLNPLPPPVYIESVTVNGVPIEVERNAVLERHQNNVQFRFTALSLAYPKAMRFEYRLEGAEDGWNQARFDQRETIYRNLGRGDYTFRVRASNNDGVWNEASRSFHFTVLPAFTETGWFFGLCGLGVVLLGSGVLRARVAQLRARERELVRRVDEQTVQIRQEQEKSDRLLLNVLPRSIADELKATSKVVPVEHGEVSVLFTDFKGFTQISEKMSPVQLVAELDRCFDAFDSIVGQRKLEKLKTIGDSYMCAGGIPTPNRTHAVDCVLCALDIREFMRQLKEDKERAGAPYWQLRLGIHTGPVVAGVVGKRKYAYDIWGDTVNTASRLESSGEPGRVNISGATYVRVKDFFVCESRGRVGAKNKGEIEMYFVEGLRPELSVDGRGQVPNDEFLRRYQALAMPL